jgi:hypothetical protein
MQTFYLFIFLYLLFYNTKNKERKELLALVAATKAAAEYQVGTVLIIN